MISFFDNDGMYIVYLKLLLLKFYNYIFCYIWFCLERVYVYVKIVDFWVGLVG